jgi:hypothetical protein
VPPPIIIPSSCLQTVNFHNRKLIIHHDDDDDVLDVESENPNDILDDYSISDDSETDLGDADADEFCED